MSVQQTINRFLDGLIEAPKALHRAAQWFVQSATSATPWLFGQDDAGASFPLGVRLFTAAGDTSSRMKTDTKTGEGACSGSSGSPSLTSSAAFGGMAVGHKVWIEGETGLFEVQTYTDSSNITLDGNLTEDATNKRFVAWAEGEEIVLLISPLDAEFYTTDIPIEETFRDDAGTGTDTFNEFYPHTWLSTVDWYYSCNPGKSNQTVSARAGINLAIPKELADHSIVEIVEMEAAILDNGGTGDIVRINRQPFPTGSDVDYFPCTAASPTNDNGGTPLELDLKNNIYTVEWHIPTSAQEVSFGGLGAGWTSENGYRGAKITLRRYGLG